MITEIASIILFAAGLILGTVLTYYLLRERAKGWFEEWRSRYEKQIRKDAVDRSRAVLKGKVGEQLAPILPVFDHEPSDARFIGSPVDYVVFKGLSEGEPEGITFADVKTGPTASLTRTERKLKNLVENGKVDWETIRRPGSRRIVIFRKCVIGTQKLTFEKPSRGLRELLGPIPIVGLCRDSDVRLGPGRPDEDPVPALRTLASPRPRSILPRLS